MNTFEVGDLPVEDDDQERIIPDIPGVEHSQPPDEQWGVLSEESDEESSENALEEIGRDVKRILTIFGVEGANNASSEEVIGLWHSMEMSQYLVADLALYTSSEIQKLSRNKLARPHFSDLREKSAILANPYDVRRDLIDQVAPNLMKLGYGRLDAYRLPRLPRENLAQAFRVEGWLLGLFFMKDLPEQIRAYVRAAPDQKIDRSLLFSMTHDEVVRQARIIDSDDTKSQYDPRIPSHLKAYKDLRRIVKDAYQIADSVLLPLSTK